MSRAIWAPYSAGWSPRSLSLVRAIIARVASTVILLASAARFTSSYVMLISGLPMSSCARKQPQFRHIAFRLLSEVTNHQDRAAFALRPDTRAAIARSHPGSLDVREGRGTPNVTARHVVRSNGS